MWRTTSCAAARACRISSGAGKTRCISTRWVHGWRGQPAAFFDEAVIDADGTLAETTGQCKEGMDIAYDGGGYHPLLVSLANTGEPLFLVNRSGNRPSSEGAAARFDQARAFKNLRLEAEAVAEFPYQPTAC